MRLQEDSELGGIRRLRSSSELSSSLELALEAEGARREGWPRETVPD
jgi:hypothetical protein